VNSLESNWIGWVLENILGFDPSRLPDDAHSIRFEWANMPQSWGVFVLIGAIVLIAAAVIFIYHREIDTCPRPVKLILAGVRFLVLLMLVMIFLEPSLRYAEIRTREPYVLVVRDASQSMETLDQYVLDEGKDTAPLVAEITGRSVEDVNNSGVSRTEVVNALFKRDNYDFARRLQRRGKVRVVNFAADVNRSRTDNLPAKIDGVNEENDDGNTKSKKTYVSDLIADGRTTDIWNAIREALNHNPLAGVVLITDGQQTTDNGSAADVAAMARDKGVKLYVVGVGDPSRPRDLKVSNIYVRPKVWPNDPFQVDAVISSEGVTPRDVRVQLVEQKITEQGQPVGQPNTVDSQDFRIEEGGRTQRISFQHVVGTVGRYRYTVRVEQLDNEKDTSNNEATSSALEVVDRKVNVLLIAGAPTWEYRMVKPLLIREKTVSVSCWLQTLDPERPQEGDMPITQLPRTMEELGKYHVVMMFDPNPAEFDDQWLELLERFVDKQAGGLLYMAGPKYSGMFLSLKRTGDIKKLLPVEFGDTAETEVNRLLESNRQAWKPRVVLQNLDHPVMSLGSDDPGRNLDLWKSMPGIYWSFPSKGPKPTTQVLLEHGDSTLLDAPRPLLIAGRYGAGNSLYVGFNGTWRWRRIGRQAQYFDRFWLQALQYLVESRSLQGMRRGYVKPERERYEVGERIVLAARLQDEKYEPLVMDEVEARIEVEGGTPLPATFRRTDEKTGRFEAILVAKQRGLHTVEINLPGDSGPEADKITTSFNVELPSAETNTTWLNRDLLHEVADLSGGGYYQLNELDKLAASIPNATEVFEVPGKPVPIWDLRGVLFLFVLLLGIEWSVRKAFKLL